MAATITISKWRESLRSPTNSQARPALQAGWRHDDAFVCNLQMEPADPFRLRPFHRMVHLRVAELHW